MFCDQEIKWTVPSTAAETPGFAPHVPLLDFKTLLDFRRRAESHSAGTFALDPELQQQQQQVATTGESPSRSPSLRCAVYGPPQARRGAVGLGARGPQSPTSNVSAGSSITAFTTTPNSMLPPPLSLAERLPAAATGSDKISPDSVSAMSAAGQTPTQQQTLRQSKRSGIHSIVVFLVGPLEFERTVLGQKLCRYLSWIGFAAKLFTAVDVERGSESVDDAHAMKFDLAAADAVAAILTPGGALPIQLLLTSSGCEWMRSMESCSGAVGDFMATSAQRPDPNSRHSVESGGDIDARVAIVNCELPTEAARHYAEELFKRDSPHAEVMFVDLFQNHVSALKQDQSDSVGALAFAVSAPFPDGESIDQSFFQAGSGNNRSHRVPYVPVSEHDDLGVARMLFAIGDVGNTKMVNISGWLPSKVVFALLNFTPALRRLERSEAAVAADGKKHKHRTTVLPLVPIFFTRHGQSEYNLEDRLGGNPHLTDKGRMDAWCIGEFMRHEVLNNRSLLRCFEDDAVWQKLADASDAEHLLSSGAPSVSPTDQYHQQLLSDAAFDGTLNSLESVSSPQLALVAGGAHHNHHHLVRHSPCARRMLHHTEVWTSQLNRTIETAQPTVDLGVTARRWSSLNEIHAGVCEDLTNKEVVGQYPEIQHFRQQDKFGYRYPRGESYQDLMHRLEPIIVELETASKCVLVVGHQAILRTLLSYFAGIDVEQAVTASAPQRTVWCCCFTRSGVPKLLQIAIEPPSTLAVPRPPTLHGHGDADHDLVAVEGSPIAPAATWQGW